MKFKNEINEQNYQLQIREEIRKNEKKLEKIKSLDFEFVNNLSKSDTSFRVDNTFTAFNSIIGYPILVYAYKIEDKYNSIATYNIADCKNMCLIKNAHNENITNFRHFFDSNNKRDLLLSISATNNNVKMWDINNLQYLLTINNINRHGFVKSACILNYNNDIFVVTSNYSHSGVPEPLRIYNLEGYKIKEINYKNNQTFFIDTYHDKNLDIVYIVTGNNGFIRSYDYTNDCKYHRYSDEDDDSEHYNIIIREISNVVQIIVAEKKSIFIWNFHTKEILNKINVTDVVYDNLYGICLWNKNTLFVGCGKELKVIDLENENIVNTLIGHDHNIITIKSVIHPLYGESIITQELYNGQIKLWTNKINKMKYIIEELYSKLN